MKKKIIVILLIVIIFIFGIYFKFRKIEIRIPKSNKPVLYSGVKGESDMNTIWCGTFQLAWNELINQYGNKIEFENYSSEIVDKLNEQNFTKDMLSEGSYYIKVAKTEPSLKQKIIEDMENKFGKKSAILNGLDFNSSNGITIYTALNKKFEFLEEFDDLENMQFGNSDNKVRCFGIDKNSDEALYKNIEIMYYDWNDESKEYEYAARLKTKENEEIILANISSTNDFEETFEKVLELESIYEDSKEFNSIDILKVPYMNLNLTINYEELCGKIIKTNGSWLETAIQNIQFSMNPKGARLFSESAVINDSLSKPPSKARILNFCKPCYMFIKETDKENPYFAIKLNANFVDIIK